MTVSTKLYLKLSQKEEYSQEFSSGFSKRIWSNSSSCPLVKKPRKLAGRLPARLPYFPLTWWMALHLLIRNCWHVSVLSCTTQLNSSWWISNSPLLLGKHTYSKMHCFITHTRMKWQLHAFESNCVLYCREIKYVLGMQSSEQESWLSCHLSVYRCLRAKWSSAT